EMTRTIVPQKYTSTAASVPIWVIAVNVAPGSVADGRNSPMMRRCALDEIGRNSVRPWTSPRMIASIRCMRVFRWVDAEASRTVVGDSVGSDQVGEHPLPELEGIHGDAL